MLGCTKDLLANSLHMHREHNEIFMPPADTFRHRCLRWHKPNKRPGHILGDVGLYAGLVGEYAGDVGLYDGLVGE
jgi:hypothetical protein